MNLGDQGTLLVTVVGTYQDGSVMVQLANGQSVLVSSELVKVNEPDLVDTEPEATPQSTETSETAETPTPDTPKKEAK